MPNFVPSPALPAMLLLVSSASYAADSIPFRAGFDLRSSLEGTVGLTWGDAPLRPALDRLAQGQPFAFLLDRRIDPDQRVQFTAKDERLEVALAKLAAQQKLGYCVVGTVICLGPKETAERLATAAAVKRWEASQVGAMNRVPRLTITRECTWQPFAEPREIITTAAQNFGVKIANPELIPHDLWPAGHWPALNFADQMTMLLAGFELSYRLTTTPLTIELVPLPAAKEYTATHTYNGEPAKAIAAIQKLFPEVKPVVDGKSLNVTAPYETQERIDRLLRGDKVRKVTTGAPTKRYTMKVDAQPAGAVAKTLAVELGKEFKYPPELREKLQQRVTFTVKDVTLDELLTKALPAGLKWRTDETVLEIFADP